MMEAGRYVRGDHDNTHARWDWELPMAPAALDRLPRSMPDSEDDRWSAASEAVHGQLMAAVGRLRQRQFEAMCHHLAGLDLTQTARAMGVSKVTVFHLLRRAKAYLAQDAHLLRAMRPFLGPLEEA